MRLARWLANWGVYRRLTCVLRGHDTFPLRYCRGQEGWAFCRRCLSAVKVDEARS